MIVYSFYDSKTGLFTGRTYSGGLLDENTPHGTVAIEGVFDHLSQRVDLDIAHRLHEARTELALPHDAVDAAATEGRLSLVGLIQDLRGCLVVDRQPPAPDSDHEWIHDDPQTGARVRRWVLKSEIAERRARLAGAKAQIAQLEAKQQRAIREAFLNPGDVEARQRVADIDDQVSRVATESGLRGNPTRDGADE